MGRTVNHACHLEHIQRPLPLPTAVTIEALLQSLDMLRTSFDEHASVGDDLLETFGVITGF